MIEIDFEDFGTNIVLSLICYALGGVAAWLLYQKLEQTPDNGPDIDSFGKPEINN